MGTPSRFDVTAFIAEQMAPTTKARWCEALQRLAEWVQPDMRLYSLPSLRKMLEYEATRVGHGHFLSVPSGQHGIIRCPVLDGRGLSVPGIYTSSDRGCEPGENPPKSALYGLDRNGKWVHLAITYDLSDLEPPHNFWNIADLEYHSFQTVEGLAELLDAWECSRLFRTFNACLDDMVKHLEERLKYAREYSSGAAEIRRYLRQAER